MIDYSGLVEPVDVPAEVSEPVVGGFVQMMKAFWQARRQGDLTADEYALGCHLANLADFANGYRTATKLSTLQADMDWNCSAETARRRLAKLRKLEFIAYDVKERHQGPFSIEVTAKLVRRPACNAPATKPLPHHEASSASPPATYPPRHASSEAEIRAIPATPLATGHAPQERSREKEEGSFRGPTTPAGRSDCPLDPACIIGNPTRKGAPPTDKLHEHLVDRHFKTDEEAREIIEGRAA